LAAEGQVEGSLGVERGEQLGHELCAWWCQRGSTG
jgi:hypothetical protein